MFKHVKTDPELCIGCKTCMAACVASHTGKALFALKPKSFDFTPRVHVVYTSKVTKPSNASSARSRAVWKPVRSTAFPWDPTRSSSMKRPAGLREMFPRLSFPAINMTKIYHAIPKAGPSASSPTNATSVPIRKRGNQPVSRPAQRKP